MAPISKQCSFFLLLLWLVAKKSIKSSVFSTWLFCFPCSTEIEAKEACDWLRAAGFPQYAQLYEGNTATALQIFPLAHLHLLAPTVSLPTSSYAHHQGRCSSISRLQFLSRGRGHGKGLVITAGTLTASLPLSLFFLPPFSVIPVPASHPGVPSL